MSTDPYTSGFVDEILVDIKQQQMSPNRSSSTDCQMIQSPYQSYQSNRINRSHPYQSPIEIRKTEKPTKVIKTQKIKQILKQQKIHSTDTCQIIKVEPQ